MSQQQPTPEEIAAMESKMSAFYESKLPFVRINHEYLTKQADIAEARVRIFMANRALIKLEDETKESNDSMKKEGADGNTNK